jgi:hypothetical protein
VAAWHVPKTISYAQRRRERNAWLALGALASLAMALWAIRELLG